jgi:hypothetical protein
MAIDPDNPICAAQNDILRQRNEDRVAGTVTLYGIRKVTEIVKLGCDDVGSPAAWAELHGLGKSHLSAVLSFNRRPGGRVLDALGLEWDPRNGMYWDAVISPNGQALSLERALLEWSRREAREVQPDFFGDEDQY